MIGLWRMKNEKGWITHAHGLDKEQIDYLHNLKEGDKLVLFENEVRGETRGPALTLKRSLLPANVTK